MARALIEAGRAVEADLPVFHHGRTAEPASGAGLTRRRRARLGGDPCLPPDAQVLAPSFLFSSPPWPVGGGRDGSPAAQIQG
jgi:hypothetical protein